MEGSFILHVFYIDLNWVEFKTYETDPTKASEFCNALMKSLKPKPDGLREEPLPALVEGDDICVVMIFVAEKIKR